MAFQQAMLTEESLRNFKEFLEIYNRTTERCFRDCIVDLSRRDLTTEEDKCLDDCTTKLTKLNHRLLGTFMVEQPRFTQKKIPVKNMFSFQDRRGRKNCCCVASNDTVNT